MKLWVYIYEDEKDDFVIGLSAVADNLSSIILQNVRFVYLCPFQIPFEALAHKHLLDSLSKVSVLKRIHKHTEETEKWLKLLFGSDYSTN